MKKFLITLLLMFSLTLSTQAQLFYYNNTIEAGIHFGGEVGNDANSPIILGSVAMYGVYFDLGGWGPSHRNDWRYNDWDDEQVFTFHIGYQVPCSRYVKLTPLIGYYSHRWGWTDGYDYYYDYYDGYKYNRFITDYKIEEFDYGLQFQVSLPCSQDLNVNLMGTITNNMAYGGIGLSILF